MYNTGDFYYELSRRLSERLSDDDVRFILGLIREDSRDPNLKVMDNSAYAAMQERGVWDVFESTCNKMGITWTHSNGLPY